MQSSPKSPTTRVLSLFACSLLLLSSTAEGMVAMVSAATRMVQWGPGPYSDSPRPVYRGNNPRREPTTRGLLWTPAALEDARRSRENPGELFASLMPVPLRATPHLTPTNEDAGEPFAWEGTPVATSGGASVNAHNGNHLTRIPLFGWDSRGD